MEQAHKDLAGKLFKAIKMLIDEKCTRQASETQTAELIQLVARLQSEKVLNFFKHFNKVLIASFCYQGIAGTTN